MCVDCVIPAATPIDTGQLMVSWHMLTGCLVCGGGLHTRVVPATRS